MPDLSYAMRVNQIMNDIQEQLEAKSACDDLDMDLIDGVLTIGFEDGAKVIINRQESVQQLWVASPQGPAHFGFDAERGLWLDDKTGISLIETLSQVFTRKLGVAVTLKD